MKNTLESKRCYRCGEDTGKAEYSEDSLYIDIYGPYCEKCFDKLTLLLQESYANEPIVTTTSLSVLGFCPQAINHIKEFITSDSLGTKQCLDWLRENRWMLDDCPACVQFEIDNILSIKRPPKKQVDIRKLKPGQQIILHEKNEYEVVNRSTACVTLKNNDGGYCFVNQEYLNKCDAKIMK